MLVNYRDGGPAWPNVVEAPNNGLVLGAVYGSPGALFGILLGTGLAPGSLTFVNGDTLDLAGATVFVQSFSPGLPGFLPSLAIPPSGSLNPVGYSPYAPQAFVPVFIPPTVPVALPPAQAVVLDPFVGYGFKLSGATQLTLKPTGGVLFVNGVQDPFGFGPQVRLTDTSALGFSQLRLNLYIAGFPAVDEFIHDPTHRLDANLLANYKVVVLAANRTPMTPTEIGLLEGFVRSGGGLIAFSDFTFGVDADASNAGSYLATCDADVSDNGVLARFGLEILHDNFAPTTTYTQFAPHRTTRGLPLGFRGEGMSLAHVVGGTADAPVVLADCATNACGPLVGGCGATPGAPPTVGALAVCEAGLGRVVVTCDRNTFLNPPGLATHLYDASNLTYAMNLFFWAAGLN